ncbi:MAG: hypothetical protein LBK72_03860 [Bifidobacteriaceae bacterium]|jgi:hypothetical protein|nr:hypothetical protein [Bifidobacteriaceae bacterium]
MSKRRLALLVAASAAGVMLFAGCTDDGAGDVASLGDERSPQTAVNDGSASETPGEQEASGAGTASAGAGEVSPGGAASAGGSDASGSASAGGTQRERADDLYNCLLAADIPVKITDFPGGEASVNITADHAAGFTSNGMAWSGAVLNDDDFAEMDRIRAQAKPIEDETGRYAGGIEGEPEVIIDGVDVTEAFDGCVTSSGYTHPEVVRPDPAEQLRGRQRVAEAGNIWAACARDHGFPMVEDVTATSDANYMPTVLLPVTITAQQVESLVEACPTFDPDAELAYFELMASGELSIDEAAAVDAPVRPVIGFDAPGWNGDMRAEDDMDPEEGENARLSELAEIIWRPYSDWGKENIDGVG